MRNAELACVPDHIDLINRSLIPNVLHPPRRQRIRDQRARGRLQAEDRRRVPARSQHHGAGRAQDHVERSAARRRRHSVFGGQAAGHRRWFAHAPRQPQSQGRRRGRSLRRGEGFPQRPDRLRAASAGHDAAGLCRISAAQPQASTHQAGRAAKGQDGHRMQTAGGRRTAALDHGSREEARRIDRAGGGHTGWRR